MYEESIKGKFDYEHTDTFMGFHCGNTCSKKLSSCNLKYQKIMARSLPREVTNGTLEGDIMPGDITFLSSAVHSRFQAACLCSKRRSSSGCNTVLWQHRCICNSRNGQILSSRSDREELSAPWRCCIWTLWQGSVRSIQVFPGVELEELDIRRQLGICIRQRILLRNEFDIIREHGPQISGYIRNLRLLPMHMQKYIKTQSWQAIQSFAYK